eukprot:Partr_v1_DN22794_c0_g1_i1_m37935 putative NADH dehydrogenase (Ubiquinone) 1 alpha subcomplex
MLTAKSIMMIICYASGISCDFHKCCLLVCPPPSRDSQNPEACALEGRKVTRCALDLMSKLEEHCAETFKDHWTCLSVSNNYMWKCRTEEKAFNRCVFEKMGLKKHIPDQPVHQIPVHMRSDAQRMYK